MQRKKILWLCSWYPSANDPFNGDFIERHAKAASIYHDITVIHIEASPEKNRWFARIKTYSRYKQAIKKYIAQNGLPDLVHVHIPLIAGLAARWVKRRYKIPFVLTEHWGIYNSVVDDNFKKRGQVFREFSRKIFKAALVCTSASRFLAEGIRKMVADVPFVIINNAVDTSLFSYNAQSQPVFRFIHVSNMVPLKNPEGILNAFNELTKSRNAELIMIGNSDNRPQEYAQKIGLKNNQVIFKGEISYAEVATNMKNASCFLLFSDIENSPCVIAEAHCCGLPVIATNTGGIPELMDSKNGILVEPRDEKQLLQALQFMMDNADNFDRQTIADTAISRYSYIETGRKFDKLYLQYANTRTV
jgi:glycosyltransferase involved in cell wall biosynthesis